MFAFVKYVEDNTDYVTEVTNVKKFDPQNFTDKKTYKVKYSDGNYYKAYIVCVAETPEEAKSKAEEKRFRMPSRKFVETSTEDESEQESYCQGQVLIDQVKVNNKTSKDTKTRICKEQYENIFAIPNTNTLYNITNNNTRNETQVIEEMKKREKQLLKKIEQLEDLNKKLQNVVINKFEELVTNVLIKDHDPPKTEFKLGERKNGQVHLGKDIWIPSHTYDAICARNNNKHSLFVKEMAVAVFGRHILASSSLTGLTSHRTKDSTPKAKLDSTKLMAIHDITRYYLQERGESLEVINKICSTINHRIAEKIQDLNRPTKKKKFSIEENNNQNITEEDLMNAEIIFSDGTGE